MNYLCIPKHSQQGFGPSVWLFSGKETTCSSFRETASYRYSPEASKRCKSRMPTKRPTTAFFVFCNEHRDACKADYVAQSGSDKVSVAAVAKLLGEKWRGLPDEQKMHYQQLAAKKAAAIAAEESVNDLELNNDTSSQADKENAEEPEQEKPAQTHPFGLPLALVKRIMCMDNEVRSVSADGLKAAAKSAELIIQLLTEKAYKAAASHKRKTIKFADVEHVVMSGKQWKDSGLRELLREDDMFEEARREGANAGGRQKKVEEDPKAQLMTSFFSKG